MTEKLEAAIADAKRGHRPGEWEGVAGRLAHAAQEVLTAGTIAASSVAAPKGLAEMQAEVTAWCERKGWKGEGSAPVTFGDTMALLHSEVSEALEAYRDHQLKDATGILCNHPHQRGDGETRGPAIGHLCKPEGVGSEFADILIRLLDDCDRWGVDLQAEFDRKMAYNETRAYQHGGRIL